MDDRAIVILPHIYISAHVSVCPCEYTASCVGVCVLPELSEPVDVPCPCPCVSGCVGVCICAYVFAWMHMNVLHVQIHRNVVFVPRQCLSNPLQPQRCVGTHLASVCVPGTRICWDTRVGVRKCSSAPVYRGDLGGSVGFWGLYPPQVITVDMDPFTYTSQDFSNLDKTQAIHEKLGRHHTQYCIELN